jgi:hypothetical protein
VAGLNRGVFSPFFGRGSESLEYDLESEGEESELLLRLRDGDNGALGVLFSLHRQRLRRLI